MIKLIMATDSKGAIAYKNRLPWNIKEELAHFYSTIDNPHTKLLMGRKTYEVISKRKIPRDQIIVVTSQDFPEVTCVRGSEVLKCIRKYKHSMVDHLFICGGKQIFEEFYRSAEELIISKVKGDFKADLFVKIDLNGFSLQKVENHELFDVFHYKSEF